MSGVTRSSSTLSTATGCVTVDQLARVFLVELRVRRLNQQEELVVVTRPKRLTRSSGSDR